MRYFGTTKTIERDLKRWHEEFKDLPIESGRAGVDHRMRPAWRLGLRDKSAMANNYEPTQMSGHFKTWFDP